MTIDKQRADRIRMKRWLRGYLSIKAEADEIEDRILKLEADAEAPAVARLTGMPHSGQLHDAMADYVIRKDQLMTDYYHKKAMLIERQTDIENAVSTLPERERQVIRLKYLDGLTWEEVCVKISYSWKQTHRIHASALDKLIGVLGMKE